MFINSREASDAALEVLKKVVRQALDPNRAAAKALKASAAAATKKQATLAPPAASRASSRPATGSTAKSMPSDLWTMPVRQINMYARKKQDSEYSRIAMMTDREEVKEAAERKQKKRLLQKQQKDFLEAQMEEKHKKKVAAQAEHLREGREIMQKVIEFEIEEDAKQKEIFRKAVKSKDERMAQVVEAKRKAKVERHLQLMEEQEQLAEIVRENERAEEIKKQKIVEARLAMRKVQEDNIRQLELDKQARQAEKERDLQRARDYEAQAEAKAAKREAELVAFQEKIDVDRAYVRCLKALMVGQGYPMVATHDPRMIEIAQSLASRYGRSRGTYEFQMLYGIRPEEQKRLAESGELMRVYIPYGEEWYGYLMRRMAERPSNLRFFLRALATRG